MPSSLQLQRATTTASSPTACHRQTQTRTSWRVPLISGGDNMVVPDHVARLHTRIVGINQCCSAVVRTIHAPVSMVWSVVRRFDNPQAYKHFLKSCQVVVGDGNNIGSLREVMVVSGLPAGSSMERLEILDEERHVLSFSVVGGENRLRNYRSITTLHATGSSSNESTVVIESYVVDVPHGNTKDDTCVFVDTIVSCNLQWLAEVSQNMHKLTTA